MLIIHNHLLCELSTEIIETQVCVLRCTERKIICDVSSECPCILKDVFIVCASELLSCREHADVVDERSRVSHTAASVRSDDDFLYRHVLQGHAWRESSHYLVTCLLVEILPDTHDGRECLTCMIGVFSEESAYRHIGNALVGNILQHNDSRKILIVSVISRTHTHCELVRFVYLILIEEVSESGMLAGNVLCSTEICIHILVGIVTYEGNVLRAILIDRNSYLEISVDRTVLDVRAPWIDLSRSIVRLVCILVIEHILSVGILQHLASESRVLKGTHAETDLHAVVSLVEPAVGKVELEHLRFIEERVAVHIMRLDVARHMTEDDGAPLIAHLKRRSDVKVHLGIAHHGRIDEERLLVCRLAMFHIDLTCHRLYAVDNRRCTLGDLDALEPLSWNI